VLPNPSGASPRQEWSLVSIPDKGEAIRAIKVRHPHAAIRVDSEAHAELLAKYDVETARSLCSWKLRDPQEASQDKRYSALDREREATLARSAV
jgi:hypothetical protein